jgi:hypothetical protein
MMWNVIVKANWIRASSSGSISMSEAPRSIAV